MTLEQFIGAAVDQAAGLLRVSPPKWKITGTKMSHYNRFTKTISFSRPALEQMDDLAKVVLVMHEVRHHWQKVHGFCQHGKECELTREIDAVNFADQFLSEGL